MSVCIVEQNIHKLVFTERSWDLLHAITCSLRYLDFWNLHVAPLLVLHFKAFPNWLQAFDHGSDRLVELDDACHYVSLYIKRFP